MKFDFWEWEFTYVVSPHGLYKYKCLVVKLAVVWKLGKVIFLFGLWGYWHCGHSWPIVAASGDSEDDCGDADGM
jgi:hypothetical protein